MKRLITFLLTLSLLLSPPLTLLISSREVILGTMSSSITSPAPQPVETHIITQPRITTKNIPLCSTSAAKTYLSYRAISKKSTQGRFIAKYMTIKNGLLYDKDNYIGVALGSYFGPIGNKFIFTLDTGKILHLIKIEEKSDRHTVNGCQQRWDNSVIEFVIDLATNKFFIGSNGYVAQGNFNNLPQFKGKITKIEQILE